MKKFNIYYVMIFAVVASIFTSCKGNDQVDPTSDFTWYTTTDFSLNREDEAPDTLLVGESITFMAKSSDGDVYSIWPGEEGYDYTKRELSDTVSNDTNYVSLKNKGIALNLNNKNEWITKYGYIYTKPGEYTVTLVVRNVYGTGEEYTESVTSKQIVVIDPDASLVGLDGAKYKFIPSYYYQTLNASGASIIKKAVISASNIEIDGTNINLVLPYEAMEDSMYFFMLANRASIEMDGSYPVTYNTTKSAYEWTGDLTEANKIYVTSLSGDVTEYTVTYEKLPALTDKELLTFGFGTYVGEITGTTVDLTVPEALDISAVQPKFTVSTFASFKDGSTVLVNNKDPKIDLSSGSKVLTVTSQSGATVDYTINIIEIPTELTALSLTNLNPVRTATIDQGTNSVAVSVFAGTDVTKLIPTFTVTQFAKLYLGDETSTSEIESGETEIDFTDPVEITVKVSATDFVTYTVTVTEEL